MNRTARGVVAALTLATLGLAACGDDDDEAAADTTAAAADTTVAPETTTAAPDTTAATETTAGAPDTTAATDGTETEGSAAASDGTTHGTADDAVVTINGVNYAFAGVPESVPAGSRLAFHNDSADEFHEMVVFRLPDEETRPVSELVGLPEEELNAVIGDDLPTAVFVAMPGEDGTAVVGDGTLAEPGRYALLCFIPVGADPATVAEAMQTVSTSPPDLGDGPPHVVEGMFAELTVTD